MRFWIQENARELDSSMIARFLPTKYRVHSKDITHTLLVIPHIELRIPCAGENFRYVGKHSFEGLCTVIGVGTECDFEIPTKKLESDATTVDSKSNKVDRAVNHKAVP